MAKKRIPFDYNSMESEEIIKLYQNGKSASWIAKHIHRGYPTVLKFLKDEELYTGPANMSKQGVPRVIIVPEVHIKGDKYYSLRHNMIAIFHGYYNNTCRIFVPTKQVYAYTHKNELIKEN